MRLFFILLITIYANLLYAQHKGDFVVTLKKDTIDVNIKKDRWATVICYDQFKKVKYSAKNILAYRYNLDVFESGKYHDPGMLGISHWIFYKKIVSGKLNLYSIITRGKKSAGHSASHTSRSADTKYFIRKSESFTERPLKLNARWRKSFKNICSDCPDLITKIYSDSWWTSGEYFIAYVHFYNDNCGAQGK